MESILLNKTDNKLTMKALTLFKKRNLRCLHVTEKVLHSVLAQSKDDENYKALAGEFTFILHRTESRLASEFIEDKPAVLGSASVEDLPVFKVFLVA